MQQACPPRASLPFTSGERVPCKLTATSNCPSLLRAAKMVLENTECRRQEQALERTPAIPTAHHPDEYSSAPTPVFHTHTCFHLAARDLTTRQAAAHGASSSSWSADPVSESAFPLFYFTVTDSKTPTMTQHSREHSSSFIPIPSFLGPKEHIQLKKDIQERTSRLKNSINGTKMDTKLFFK